MLKLSDILTEKEDKDFGNVAFGDPNQDSGYPELLKLQGKSAKDKEGNTKIETKLLDVLLYWVQSSDTSTSNKLTQLLPSIKKGKKLFPKIFAPDSPNGTIVYRGLENINNKLLDLLAKKTTNQDWKPMKEYMVCQKPIKYSPRSNWQSWSYDSDIAETFGGNAVLMTQQTDEFYFSSETLNILYSRSGALVGDDEQEVLHYGRKFGSSVYIALDIDLYKDYMLQRFVEKPKNGKKQGLDTVAKQLLGKKKK